jgi:hypothetical protein
MDSEEIRVEEALKGFTEILEADGYVVTVGIDDGGIEIGIDAGPDACATCLVPEPVMREIARRALTDAGFALGPDELRIRYPQQVA